MKPILDQIQRLATRSPLRTWAVTAHQTSHEGLRDAHEFPKLGCEARAFGSPKSSQRAPYGHTKLLTLLYRLHLRHWTPGDDLQHLSPAGGAQDPAFQTTKATTNTSREGTTNFPT